MLVQNLQGIVLCKMRHFHGESLEKIKENAKNGLTGIQAYLLEKNIPEEYRDLFFSDNLKHLHNPFLLPDISDAIALIRKSIRSSKHILLYGDRDTDGVSSSSLLYMYLRKEVEKYNGKISIRTSSSDDDYGLCPPVMETIKKIHPDLLITLDFGTSNFEEINELAESGMKIIVLDHHEIPVKIPNCLLINPKREDSIYPEKKICTSFLALKLIQALILSEIYEKELIENSGMLFLKEHSIDYKKIDYHRYIESNSLLLEKTKEYTDLSSIGTITDMMPLLGENRILVRNGIKTLEKLLTNSSPDRKGLKNLLANLGLNPNKIVSKDLGWGIGPVLNAAGRMGKTEVALNLLTTIDDSIAEKETKEILQINKERKERTKRNLFRVEQYFQRKPERKKDKIIFCFEPDMEPGVSGIVASRLVEEYKRPVVFITPDHGRARGSIRSYGKENVIVLMDGMADLLDHYGGHPEAGGFSIDPTKIPLLQARLRELAETWLDSSIQVDDMITSTISLKPEELTEEIFQNISTFEPFGQGNPIPILSVQSAEIISFKTMGDGTHARFSILKASSKIKGVIWNRAREMFQLLSQKNKLDLWGNLEENYFNGNTSIQFVVTHFE